MTWTCYPGDRARINALEHTCSTKINGDFVGPFFNPNCPSFTHVGWVRDLMAGKDEKWLTIENLKEYRQ